MKVVLKKGLMLAVLFWGTMFGVFANSIVESGENHFRPVWYGENGTGHMNFYVLGAMLDNQPLEIGDEIAICSGDICVGSGKLEMKISDGKIESFVSIITSKDDGTNNGFVVGDTVLFRIWDASEEVEYEASKVIYRSDLSTWRADGKFESGASSFVLIEAVSFVEQTIALKSGWNVVSPNVVPQEADLKLVMKDLIDEGLLLKVKDQSGNTLEDWGELGGWVNGIGDISETQGYRVYVTDDCELVLRGTEVELPLEINLQEGWNTISFPYDETVDASSVLKSLMDQGILVKAKDEEGNAIEFWDEDGWINKIGVFEPGKGYDVKVNSDASLFIGSYYLKSQKMVMFELQPVHFILGYDGNGTDHMNVNIESFSGLGLESGDEIALFDGDVCVGVKKLTSDDILEGSVSINASRASLGEKNGFTSGNKIKIMVWQERADRELEMIPDVVKGELVFKENESVFVRLTRATATKKLSADHKLKVYPNPATDRFSVSFSGILQSDAVLQVMDLSGRITEERMVSSQVETFNVQSYHPGLYFVSLLNGDDKQVWRLNIR